MTQPKLTIAFYSTYGTNHQMAEAAADAARAAGAEVRLRRIAETAPQAVIDTQDAWKAHAAATAHIPEATADDMDWADGYFFIAPTRFGGMPSQVRAFIDTLGGLWFQGKLANKTVTAATSASHPHSGHESTLLSLYQTFMHWGTFIVTPGFTDDAVTAAGGNPYGTSAIAGKVDDATRAAIAHQTRRLVDVTARLARSGAAAKAA